MAPLYGAQNKEELHPLTTSLASLHRIHLKTAISRKALQLIEHYSKSHAMQIPDALIAATAIHEACPIFTLNAKDFQFIPDLFLYKPELK